MAQENRYLGKLGLPQLIEEIKSGFAKLVHTHKLSEITDYTVDSEIKSNSENPVQNQVIKEALDLKVPITRTVNGKSLEADINLSASDVGTMTSDEIASGLDEKANATEVAYIDIEDNENVNDISTVLTTNNLVDNLESTSTTSVLTANQGRVLKENIDELSKDIISLEEIFDENVGESNNKFDLSKITEKTWIYADGHLEAYDNSFIIGKVKIPSFHTLIFSYYLIENGRKYYNNMRGGCVYDADGETITNEISLDDQKCGYYNSLNHDIYVTVNIASAFLGYVESGERKLYFDIVNGDVTSQLSLNGVNTIVPYDYDENEIEILIKKSFLPKDTVYKEDIKDFGYGIVKSYPSYHEDEIEETIKTILDNTKTPSLVFSVMSDLHCDRTNEVVNNAIRTMNGINKKVYIDSIVALGDFNVSDTTMTQIESDKNINRIRSEFLEANHNVYMVQGNHDGKNGGVADVFNNFNTMQSQAKNVIRPYGKSYFYVDYADLNVRCFFLNTVERIKLDSNEYTIWGLWTDQLNWLKESLDDLENDWDWIIFTHVGTFSNDFVTGTDTTAHINNQEFIDIINNYNAHTGTYSEKTGHCILYMCGHEHFDWIVPSEYSKITSPVVVITNVGLGNSEPTNSEWGVTLPTKVEGTYKECAWDVMIYNKDDKKIYFVRYGAGQDREVDLTNYFN